jgi:hypothetical protein
MMSLQKNITEISSNTSAGLQQHDISNLQGNPGVIVANSSSVSGSIGGGSSSFGNISSVSMLPGPPGSHGSLQAPGLSIPPGGISMQINQNRPTMPAGMSTSNSSW